MSSSAQRDLYEDAAEIQQRLGATGTDGAATLRRLAAERLAAHRSKRPALDPGATPAQRPMPKISESAKRAREAVVARYSATPTYREALATETHAAAATPVTEPPTPRWIEEPVRAARPVAVPEAIIAEPVPAEPIVAAPLMAVPAPIVAAATAPAVEEDFAWLDAKTEPIALPTFAMPEPAAPTLPTRPVGEWQVRPFEELSQLVAPPAPLRITEEVRHEEIADLDEEIAFRLAPEFQEHLIEPLPIQANIIEFPRQLVAARKARPRLAEGPFRTDEAAEYHDPFPPAAPAEPEFQMRIFEVEPLPPMPASQVAEVETPLEPEWQHMVLDAAEEEDEAPSWRPLPEPEMSPAPTHDLGGPLPVASFELRLMSAAVDAICVGVAFVAFAAVAGWIGGHQLRAVPVRTLGIISAGLLGLLAIFYQALFLTLSRSTPGMYYANLVFRTLAGREPSRRMMRRRVGANVLAALPLGLGLLWSLVDRRNLGWNDRISGIFLREY
ncbi:RDD family protein [Granulicella sp. 5B5]|uniref:RDD family protein n=1 Tax=Granulicella sp. 5B5 TaxID=1617967 RepID=UPI0015F62D95|nr:RDD family protein [Granulicella sp. 5B5]